MRRLDVLRPEPACFAVVCVGDRGRSHPGRYTTLRSALAAIAMHVAPVNARTREAGPGYWPTHDVWRVVHIPAGEPIDYDGTIVAELRLGWGVA